MTPQRAKELLPVIQAFAEGKSIEVRATPICNEWQNTTDPNWAELLQYRIKPSPREFWILESNNRALVFTHEDSALNHAGLQDAVIHVREVIED